MHKAVVGFAAVALAFSVVSFWVRWTEPTTVGPLLAVPTPAVQKDSSSEPDVVVKDREFLYRENATGPVTSGTPEPLQLRELSEKRRNHVRRLVRQLRPQQPEPAIEIWVKEFGHLSDDEITFLLDQSAPLGGVGITSTTLSPTQVEVPAAASTDPPMKDPRGNTARRNLRNSMTVGYRDQLELNLLSAGENAEPLQVSFRRLTAGEAFETNDPLHVALRTPGLIFFQLTDGRLTRNGMFSRMDDGRLGLLAGNRFVALQDSPVVSGHLRCEILSDGHVIASGNSKPIGRVRVVSVERGDQLATNDGVYFRTDEDVKLAERFVLQTGAVELSNVNINQNRQILRALHSQ